MGKVVQIGSFVNISWIHAFRFYGIIIFLNSFFVLWDVFQMVGAPLLVVLRKKFCDY